jgi:hypothetical protein
MLQKNKDPRGRKQDPSRLHINNRDVEFSWLNELARNENDSEGDPIYEEAVGSNGSADYNRGHDGLHMLQLPVPRRPGPLRAGLCRAALRCAVRAVQSVRRLRRAGRRDARPRTVRRSGPCLVRQTPGMAATQTHPFPPTPGEVTSIAGRPCRS